MLLDRFQGWCPVVLERLECTKPEDVERRDVFDVLPDHGGGRAHGAAGRLGARGAAQPRQDGGQDDLVVFADELPARGTKGVKNR